MRKNLGADNYLVPQPVMIIGTYDESGKANAMNAAWGGICGQNMIVVELGNHKTTDNIRRNGAFTISPGEKKQVIACDFVGVASGNKYPDKMEKAGFTVSKSEFVNAPIINELPLTLECSFVKEEDGRFYGKIVNVSADEAILGEDGQPDYSLFTPITFDPIRNKYIALGDVVGEAFSDGKKLL